MENSSVGQKKPCDFLVIIHESDLEGCGGVDPSVIIDDTIWDFVEQKLHDMVSTAHDCGAKRCCSPVASFVHVDARSLAEQFHAFDMPVKAGKVQCSVSM